MGQEESKRPCYIYVGDQIKYEPGYLNELPDRDKKRSSVTVAKKLADSLESGNKNLSRAFDFQND